MQRKTWDVLKSQEGPFPISNLPFIYIQNIYLYILQKITFVIHTLIPRHLNSNQSITQPGCGLNWLLLLNSYWNVFNCIILRHLTYWPPVSFRCWSVSCECWGLKCLKIKTFLHNYKNLQKNMFWSNTQVVLFQQIFQNTKVMHEDSSRDRFWLWLFPWSHESAHKSTTLLKRERFNAFPNGVFQRNRV